MATYVYNWPPLTIAGSFPLPAGAATSANQTNGNQKTKIVDGSGNVIASTSNSLNVNVQNASIPVTGTFYQATQPISAVSLPLPSGAATDANQTNGNQKTQLVDGSGNVIASTNNSLNVNSINGVVSTANSSTTPLGISASFTGTSANITNYSSINILVATDRSGTLSMQFSSDGTNWDHDDTYACTVTTGGVTQSFYFQGATVAKYFRIKYDNGATAQGVFRLQTVFKVNVGVGDIQDLTTAPVDASNGMITKSVIYGLTTGGGGGYVAVKVNPSGALTTNVSGTVAATQSGTWNIDTVSTITNAVAVTGTFWQATQPVSGTFWQATQPVSGTFWQATQPVSVAALPATTGRAKVGQLYNDYTTTNVTTAAYVQLTASTAATVNQIEIFDSSGEALILAVGAAASEVDQLYIFPGGNGPVQLAIPASSRISVKAKTATASAGFLAINLYS